MTDHDTTDTTDTDTTGHDDYPNVHAWSWYDREPAHVYDTDQHDTDTDTTDRPGHIWQYGRFTGTRTCARCHLLPVHHDDHLAPCIPDNDHDYDTYTTTREDTTP